MRPPEARRAWVCGSTQGIGRACAVELARLGAEVMLLARDETALRRTAGELPAEAGQKHSYLCADFADPRRLREVVSRRLHGAGPVHVLVNNTGGPPGGPILEADVDQFLQAFKMHLVCNQILVQALVPGMKQAGYGRIINIVSTSVKQPIEGLGVSNTVRAAVANWAKTLASELAPSGITVNNILPGATLTGRLESIIQARAAREGKSVERVKEEMLADIPARRFASPEEIAAAVGFLASPAAGYITGVNLPVDGGRTGCL